MNPNFPVRAAVPALFFCLAAANAQAGEDTSGSSAKFKFGTGIDYTSGDYGIGLDTDITFVPIWGRLDTDSIKIKVTVPYIRIEGPAAVVGGIDAPVIIGEGGEEIVERSGLGDIVASLTYKVPALGHGLPFIDLTGKVKIPTADETKGLGTGATDYSGQVDVFQKFGNVTLFGSLGYRVLGDAETFELNDGVIASGGFLYKISPAFNGGLILDYRSASTDASDGPLELMPYTTWKVNRHWSFQAYGVFGLSNGSPDAGGGLQIILSSG